MEHCKINEEVIQRYKNYLQEEERSVATIDKYIRDIFKFYHFLPVNKRVDKSSVLLYKNSLISDYKVTSINSMLVALNGFLEFLKLNVCKVKLCRLQKKMFASQHKELTKSEYLNLLNVAKKRSNERLYMLIQTICATGIRVSEHKEITVEALQRGVAIVNNKGKTREIYIEKKLQKMLFGYCKRNHIKKGSIFVTNKGLPLDRSNIWKMMKGLCSEAGVHHEKVFPHNLRHLFAYTYYQLDKDLVRLASVLGHSSIETTRVYTMSTGIVCAKHMSKMRLIQNE